jgi:hypothetical protein
MENIINNLRVMQDKVGDFTLVYLYHKDIKVGKMEYRVDKTRYQGEIKILTNYNFTPEFTELFKDMEAPIAKLSDYVRTILV